jgi:hypothetical protein
VAKVAPWFSFKRRPSGKQIKRRHGIHIDRALSSSPRNCSGEQKVGVPRNAPVAVSAVGTAVEIEGRNRRP